MKKIFTKANVLMVASHLKDNAFRYMIASGVVSLFGLAATETDKVSNGLVFLGNLLDMLANSALG